MVILDTDLVTLLERANDASGANLRHRLLALRQDQISTTVITYEEQMRGWLAYVSRAGGISREVEAYRRLSAHIVYYGAIKVHAFDELAAVEYQRLRRERPRIGTMDLKIASIVLSLKATLLSRNLKDFTQIPGLNVQDWSL